MIYPSDIHTLTAFKRDSSVLFNRLEKTGRAQILIVDGQPKAALLSIALFERLAELIDREETVEAIREGLADMQAGRTMSLEESERQIRKRLGLRKKKGSKSA